MIQVTGEYNLIDTDFETADRATDELLDALYLVDDILDPDITLSMSDMKMEILFVIDTVDILDAMERGLRAIRSAFEVTGSKMPETRMWVDRSLLHSTSAGLRTELVPA